MRKITLFVTTILLLVTLLFQTSCVKDGVNGRDGLAGSQGAQGVQGVAGTSGTNGKDGSTNVFGKVYNFQESDWMKVTLSGNKFNYHIYANVPEITQVVVDRGMVAVYEKTSIGFQALPYSYGFEYASKTYVIDYDAIHSLGGVAIFKAESDGLPSKDGARTYKIVVISPSGLAAHPDVDFKNYSKVVEAFNLND